MRASRRARLAASRLRWIAVASLLAGPLVWPMHAGAQPWRASAAYPTSSGSVTLKGAFGQLTVDLARPALTVTDLRLRNADGSIPSQPEIITGQSG